MSGYSTSYNQYLGKSRCCDIKVQGPAGIQGPAGPAGIGPAGRTGPTGPSILASTPPLSSANVVYYNAATATFYYATTAATDLNKKFAKGGKL